MKHFNIKKLFIIAMVLLCSVNASAHDFEQDGIYYKIISTSNLTVEVTYKGNNYNEFYNEYNGEVIIPETVNYKSKVLKITRIDSYAFCQCPGLTSVVIGNGVTSIGESAFRWCSGLTSVVINNNVTNIENYAFTGCNSLKDLHIEDGIETLSLGYNSYNNQNYAPYTGGGLFSDCPLEKLYLGRNLSYNEEQRYGYSPFYENNKLTSVTIGSSVTSIGKRAFFGCDGLTSVVIGNSVTSIGDYAFGDCTGLISVEIPNSVTSIGSSAFNECAKLTSVVIGNSVTSIGDYAFRRCSSLTSIHLLGKTPPTVGSSNFTEGQYATLTIYVPQGSLSTYQSSDVWRGFWDIREEGTTGTPEEEVKKCTTPVITYNNSGLDITTETDGAEIHTNITCNDANSYNSSRIVLTETYSITTYATKSGYLNSEIVTATLCWIAVNGGSEEDGIIEVEAMPVLITCNNGTINISGGKDGAEVVIYTTSGVAVGNATITNGNATISTGLAKGEIAVISIAGKGIKIVMQ